MRNAVIVALLALGACAVDPLPIDVGVSQEGLTLSYRNSNGGAVLNTGSAGWATDMQKVGRGMAMGYGCVNNHSYWSCVGSGGGPQMSNYWSDCTHGAEVVSIDDCVVMNGNPDTLRCAVFTYGIWLQGLGTGGNYWTRLMFASVVKGNTWATNLFYDERMTLSAGQIDYQASKLYIGVTYAATKGGVFCP